MDKAVILARGLGTRMRRGDGQAALSEAQQAVAATGVKALIPIGRPFLDYVLSALADAGYRRVCLVVAPDHEAIRSHYAEVSLSRIAIDFAVQVEPKGTADAVAAAEAFAGEDDFLVINSDNYYPPASAPRIARVRGFRGRLVRAREHAPREQHRARARAEFRPRPAWPHRALGTNHREAHGVDDGGDAAAALAEHELLAIHAGHFCRLSQHQAVAARRMGSDRRGSVRHRRARRAVSCGPGLRPVLDMTSREDVATIKPKLEGIEVRL